MERQEILPELFHDTDPHVRDKLVFAEHHPVNSGFEFYGGNDQENIRVRILGHHACFDRLKFRFSERPPVVDYRRRTAQNGRTDVPAGGEYHFAIELGARIGASGIGRKQ